MNILKNKFKSLIILLLVAGTVFAAGGNRNGTAGATELTIPVGARGVALGGAALVNSVGSDAIFWNPANLARANHGFDMQFSHMEYLADISVEYGAVGFKMGNIGTVGLSLKSFSFGDIPKTTFEHEDGTGQTFSPQYMVLGLTYSNMLSDRVAVGLTMNYVSEKIDLVEATGMAFNIGISYYHLASIEGLKLGIVLRNLGSDMQFDGSGLLVLADQVGVKRDPQYYKINTASFSLPTSIDISLGYDYDIDEQNAVSVAGTFVNHNYYYDEYNAGLEYSFDKMLFLRAGYKYFANVDDGFDQVYSFSFGAGINYKLGNMNVILDYAYQDADLPGESANHMITVGLGL